MSSRSIVSMEPSSGQPSRALTQVGEGKATAEVQSGLAIAKRFPRDQQAVYDRILAACKRPSLAEAALYSFPRGNETVTGPSIRLAEMLAQNWGNLEFGVVEVEQRQGESVMTAYAWDLETNTRQIKTFTVKHERHTRRGSQVLTDTRDIYEMVANQGARRLRACILGVIPGDIIEDAVKACELTMAGGNNAEPMETRAKKMVQAFAEYKVSQQDIERHLKHKLDSLSEAELVALKKIYRTVKDGVVSADHFFGKAATADLNAAVQSSSVERIKELYANMEITDTQWSDICARLGVPREFHEMTAQQHKKVLDYLEANAEE